MSKMIIGFCALLMLTITPSVHADPIQITGGSVTVSGFFGPTTYSLVGQNFSITGGGEGGFTAPRNCFPCLSGASLGMSTFIIGNGLGTATVTINGTTFSNLSILGTLNLDSFGITIPASMTNVTLTAPFSLSASLFGCEGLSATCTSSNAVFSTTLIGGGTATLQLLFFGVNAQGNSLYTFGSITYDFGGAAPVPEPMTIILLGTGAMSLGATLRLSSKRRR